MGRVAMVATAAIALAEVVLAAGSPAPAARRVPVAAAPRPAVTAAPTPADVARGKALFTGTCGAYCHRPSGPSAGEAASDAPSLFDCNWLHGGSDAEVFRTISKGVEGTRMVAFGGAIPDADIWRIIAYLRSASQCTAGRPA